MSAQEKVNLIFHDGLSTAESVSEVSGRGVGMSAVARAVRSIGATLSVTSTMGAGTTFTIWVPKLPKKARIQRMHP